MAVQVWEVGRSEGHAVMVWIQGKRFLGMKMSPRPTGLLSQENLENRNYGEIANDNNGFATDWCILIQDQSLEVH